MGIEHVNQAVVHLEQNTHQNASVVEKTASAAAALRLHAVSLAETVARFDLGDDGHVAHRSAPESGRARVSAPAPAPQWVNARRDRLPKDRVPHAALGDEWKSF